MASLRCVAFLWCHLLVRSDRAAQEILNDVLAEHSKSRAHDAKKGPPTLQRSSSLLQTEQEYGAGLKVAMSTAVVRRHQNDTEAEHDKDGKEEADKKSKEQKPEEQGDKNSKEQKPEEEADKNSKEQKPEEEGEKNSKEQKPEDTPESFDDNLGVPIPNVPEMPSTMFSKLKAELASDGPVETSIRETDEAGDETMKDAKEWRETEKELQQATEDLGKASHKAASDLREGTLKLQKGRSKAAQDIEKELEREEDQRND